MLSFPTISRFEHGRRKIVYMEELKKKTKTFYSTKRRNKQQEI